MHDATDELEKKETEAFLFIYFICLLF